MKCRKTIQGKIIWQDDDNAWDTRPSFLEVNLTRNGEIIQSTAVSSAEDSFAFNCMPRFDSTGNLYIYSIRDSQVPQGYEMEVEGFNAINRLIKVNITYVFNNIVHIDYTGKVYTEEIIAQPAGRVVDVKRMEDVFPEYTGDCHFVGWNTRANGSGTYYYPDSSVAFEENITLYAIWKSCMPQVNDVYAESNYVTGHGVISKGNLSSNIMVHFGETHYVATNVLQNNIWSTAVPTPIRPLEAGRLISVTQIERGKLVSDPKTTIVKR